jgi:hypothetical protein
MKVFIKKLIELYGTPEDVTEADNGESITLTLPNGLLVKGKKVFSSIFDSYKTLKITEVIGDNADLKDKIGQYLKIKVGEVEQNRCGIAGFIPQKIKDLIAANSESFFQNGNTPTVNTDLISQGLQFIKQQLPTQYQPISDQILTPSIYTRCSNTTPENTSDDANTQTPDNTSDGSGALSQILDCSQIATGTFAHYMCTQQINLLKKGSDTTSWLSSPFN